ERMMDRPQTIALGLLMACSLLLVGCGPRDTAENATKKSADGSKREVATQETTRTNVTSYRDRETLGGVKPAEDDVLLLFYGDDPDTLNLVTSSDNVSATFQRPVYEYLARRQYGNPEEWEAQLAESWEFDKENLEFTIHL